MQYLTVFVEFGIISRTLVATENLETSKYIQIVKWRVFRNSKVASIVEINNKCYLQCVIWDIKGFRFL